MLDFLLPLLERDNGICPSLHHERNIPMAKAAPSKPQTKTEIVSALAEKTGLTKKDIANVFTELSALVQKDLGNRGPGVFTVPGLVKLTVIKKPAVKARKGINPFTKEPTVFAAKPARKVVKAMVLKAVKDMV